jgi:hypothetical protein
MVDPLFWKVRSPRTLPPFHAAVQRKTLTKAEWPPLVLNEALSIRDHSLYGVRHTKVREVKSRASSCLFTVPDQSARTYRNRTHDSSVLHITRAWCPARCRTPPPSRWNAVQQSGQVCCPEVRLTQVRLTQVRLTQVRLTQVRLT